MTIIILSCVITLAMTAFCCAVWYTIGYGRGFKVGRAHRSDHMLQIVRHTMRETTREVRDMEEKRVAAKWN